MSEVDRVELGAFDATLRRRSALRWLAHALGPEGRVEFAEGTGDLLLLDHTPSRHFSGREPIHQSLMIELASPLPQPGDGVAGVQPLVVKRLVYRAGTERLTYQATAMAGSIELLEVRADGYLLKLELTLLEPQLDVEHLGERQLAGVVFVEGSADRGRG